jgi:hypothetical protein
MQPWEVDPDGPPRAPTLGETLLSLEHFGACWVHAPRIQELRPERSRTARTVA